MQEDIQRSFFFSHWSVHVVKISSFHKKFRVIHNIIQKFHSPKQVLLREVLEQLPPCEVLVDIVCIEWMKFVADIVWLEFCIHFYPMESELIRVRSRRKKEISQLVTDILCFFSIRSLYENPAVRNPSFYTKILFLLFLLMDSLLKLNKICRKDTEIYKISSKSRIFWFNFISPENIFNSQEISMNVFLMKVVLICFHYCRYYCTNHVVGAVLKMRMKYLLNRELMNFRLYSYSFYMIILDLSPLRYASWL